MPSISVSVQDFRFSPPSISAELPCTLQFKLLPHSSRQQITVLHSDSGKRVASSGVLRGGDCFKATICHPGAYTFTSEVYPFMSGTLTAAAAGPGAAPAEEEDAAAATKAPLHEAAGTMNKLQTAGRQSPAPGSSRSHADSPRLAAKAVLQHQQQQMYQRKSSSSSDTDTPATPDAAGGAASPDNAAEEQQAAVLTPGAGTAAVFKYAADASDSLFQQPSECAVLELLSTTAARHAGGHPSSSVATTSSLANLSRAGRWARRATAYDDEGDTAPHMDSAWQPGATQVQQLSESLGGTAASAVMQGELAATSHFSVLAGSNSASCSSSIGAGVTVAAAAAAATSAAHAEAATCGVAGSCMLAAADAAPEDMDIDGDSYVAAQTHQQQQQQQEPGAPGLALLGFAKGLEGLTFSPEPLPGQSAAAVRHARSGHQWAVGPAGWLQYTPAAASSEAEQAADTCSSCATEDGSDTCDRHPVGAGDDGLGWYEQLRNDSDHSSASSSVADEQVQQGVAGEAQHRPSLRQNSEAACLLGDDGGVQRRRLPAWGCSVDGSDDGEAPSPASSSSSEGASGDVRLRTLHGRSTACTAAAQQRQQQRQLEDADEVLLVEDIEEYRPYEPLDSGDEPAAPEPAAAHSSLGAILQPRLLGDAARAGTAEAAAQTLPPLRNRAGLLPPPPGSSWSLGGSASLTVGGGVRSTFSSTNHAPLAGSERAGSDSSSRYAANSEGGWASAAAAATRPTYYEHLTSSRTHVGLGASGQVVSSGSSSTLLGPGRHVIGQQALRQQASGSSTASAGSIEDPVAQLEQVHREKALWLRQHQLQLAEAADSDGTESPPELSVRLAQKRQQQLAAAAASLEPGSAAAAAAAAAGAAAKACSKKKKGRSRAAASHASERITADEASAASRAAAAAAERRRERDHLECALYDRGSGSASSRGDSEVSQRQCQQLVNGGRVANACLLCECLVPW
jgi:hypothetical protein